MTQLHNKCKLCRFILTPLSIIHCSFSANGIIHIGLISIILLAYTCTGISKSDPLKDEKWMCSTKLTTEAKYQI